MARYIDAELIQKLKHKCIARYPLSYVDGIFALAKEIADIPTADVAEVVRCEKCIDYLSDTPYCKKHNIGYCDRDGAIKQKNHFCGFGERRTDNEL